MPKETIADQLVAALALLDFYGAVAESEQLNRELDPYLDRFQAVESYQSGGGILHLFCHLHAGHILSFHLDSGDVELSYRPYPSVDKYLNDSWEEQTGFGYEWDNPGYDQRHKNFSNWQDLLPQTK
jgi:hypothetical protein